MKESVLSRIRLTVWKLAHSEPATSYHQFKARKILSINSHLSAGYPFLRPDRPFHHFHPLTASSPHLQCLGTWLGAANGIVWTNIVKPFILLSLYFYFLICEFIESLYPDSFGNALYLNIVVNVDNQICINSINTLQNYVMHLLTFFLLNFKIIIYFMHFNNIDSLSI